MNRILLTDSYKLSHWKLYPPGIEKAYAYFEARKPNGNSQETVFFGLQYILRQYLEGRVIHPEDIEEAEAFCFAHFGRGDVFNRAGWEHILAEHKGCFPVSIKAVPEGSVVPVQNVLMTVESTCPRCYWIPNFLETLLVQVWYPMSVASISREIKKIINHYLDKTGGASLIDFKLHDFGFRGVSSVESAGLGGAAHLINFQGTDTIPGILFAQKYYGADMAGFSIPATEHSTITSWGKENEVQAMEHVLDQYGTGLVACVSDSYDIFRACSEYWGKALREKILFRDGALVVRPDSGDPVTTVLQVLEILGKRFGADRNPTGYKTLPPQVRVIQGDGVDPHIIDRILFHMAEERWSADNIAFGMGGALLQKLNRDTYGCAFKCSSVTVRREERPVFKDPVTDPGKTSKKGRLKLSRIVDGDFSLYQTMSVDEKAWYEDYMVEVFRDGEVLEDHTFDEIRQRARV